MRKCGHALSVEDGVHARARLSMQARTQTLDFLLICTLAGLGWSHEMQGLKKLVFEDYNPAIIKDRNLNTDGSFFCLCAAADSWPSAPLLRTRQL